MVKLTKEDLDAMKVTLKQFNCELMTLHGDFWKVCRRKINTLKDLIQETEKELDGTNK